MNKQIFILAMTALGFVACSSDETVTSQATSEGNAISFRTTVAGQTRAADKTSANLGSFNVEAFNAGTTSNPYFSSVTFTNNNGTYTSANKYYWPATGNLDFYAYSPIDGASNQVSKTDYKTFSIIPSSTISQQVDFVYACNKNQSKVSNGVPLNFRHAGSKIVLKVKNTSPTLKFEVSGWKIFNVGAAGTFVYDRNSHDGNTSSVGTLDNEDWHGQEYDTFKGEFGTANVIPVSAPAKFLNSNSSTSASETTDENLNMILIPHSQSRVTQYASASLGSGVSVSNNNAYIAVKMVIKNNDGSVIFDASTENGGWAMWPVDIDWKPGKKYTYTIDLGDGGYYEKNHDSNIDLDPILEGAEIKFVNVTVDTWEAQSVYLLTANSSTSIDVPAAGGIYIFNISGLTSGEHVEAEAQGGGTISFSSDISLNNSTVPNSGSVILTVPVAANTQASTKEATITVTNVTTTTTITFNQEAAGN